jgi:hypothetical protein
MRLSDRRMPWLCLGLGVLAINLLALAVWRVAAAYSGDPDALWWYEPSPLEPEYERLAARRDDVEARFQAGDPDVKWEDVWAAWEAEDAQYRALDADLDARWEAAQDAEARVYIGSFALGLALGAAAVVLLALYWAADPSARRPRRHDGERPVYSPPPAGQVGPTWPPPGLTVIEDGWATSEPEFLRFLRDHPPPRPHGYLDQLGIDVRCWKVWRLWAAGAGAVVVGWAFEQWLLVPGGLFLLGTYVYCLVRATNGFRHSPLVTGVVEEWDVPSRLRGFDTATARLADGRTVRVGAHRGSTRGAIDPDELVEVLLLHHPGKSYCSVCAIRPAREVAGPAP